MTIERDWLVLDTNVWIFGVREQSDQPACGQLLRYPESDSFDVKLNKLLYSKKTLKDAIITPDEVQVTDFMNTGIFGKHGASSTYRITIDDVPALSWELFEVLIAELYAREFVSVTGSELRLSVHYGEDGAR